MRRRLTPSLLASALLLASFEVVSGQGSRARVGPPAELSAIAASIERFVAHEMEDKHIAALSLALVDDQEIVWARGFGQADPEGKVDATAETVYRVGSVSKLFTDIGVMRLAERGRLDIDAPVTRHLPDFKPANPFGTAITLRMLMSHRSGLVREPPVGNYFETTEPSLADTVRSLNDTRLVYEPGRRIKYSNAGIAAVGYALERASGEPFATHLERQVLGPLGLRESSFSPRPDLAARTAKAYMWTYDGRSFLAPTFQLGMAPAGSMYSTVVDLGRFVSVLFAGGRGPGGTVIEKKTLDEMWTPQFASDGSKRGFGIGFAIGELEGRRRVGHDGAIYGFATTLQALPDDKLGAVVIATKDSANPVVDRIAEAALRMMLARRAGRPLPEPEVTQPIDRALARRLAGRYANGPRTVDLVERGGALYMTRSDDDQRLRLRARKDGLVVDDVNGFGLAVSATPERVTVGAESFDRAAVPAPAPLPADWKGLVGEYGWDHDILFVLEKEGRLHALIEWFTEYPLEAVSKDVFRFPDRGLYPGEELSFTRDSSGRATEASVAGVVFARRPDGPAGGATFRIQPTKPVAELRKAALAARPPDEKGEFRRADLVELTKLDPTIRLDIRYAGTENFLSSPVYEQARAFLQRPAAEALVRAHQRLGKDGFGLLIHDGYRPWFVTRIFWDATPPEGKIFVADPSQGSRHNRGCAVDLTLFDKATGKPLEMPGVYDEMSPRSFPDYPGGTSQQRANRERLRWAMEEEGFEVYEFEWWHFDYKDWRLYPILNVGFDAIGAATTGP
jgi:CubicO group peptidase (beta-lactamase class C family)/D-alanyl-D-alanine dipeptidase